MDLIVRSFIFKKGSGTIHILHKVKIVHAAWLRDGTWPVGIQAPDSDEIPIDERTGHNPLTIQFAPIAVTDSSEVNDTTAL